MHDATVGSHFLYKPRFFSEVASVCVVHIEFTFHFSACCDKLPTSGAMTKQQVNNMKNSARIWFRNFVATATQANWKFYIFSLIFQEVFETYCEKVCCSTSREVLRRCTISWLEDNCDLPQLRKRKSFSVK